MKLRRFATADALVWINFRCFTLSAVPPEVSYIWPRFWLALADGKAGRLSNFYKFLDRDFIHLLPSCLRSHKKDVTNSVQHYTKTWTWIAACVMDVDHCRGYQLCLLLLWSRLFCHQVSESLPSLILHAIKSPYYNYTCTEQFLLFFGRGSSEEFT